MNERFEIRPAGPANPFEGFLLAVCVLQGFLVMSGASNPTSISNALPPVLRVLWASMLMFGGLIALSGLYWPGNPFTGAEVKRVGLISCGFSSLAYGVALIGVGSAAYVASAMSLAFAAAAFWRLYQVTSALRAARARINATVRLVDFVIPLESDDGPDQADQADQAEER